MNSKQNSKLFDKHLVWKEDIFDLLNEVNGVRQSDLLNVFLTLTEELEKKLVKLGVDIDKSDKKSKSALFETTISSPGSKSAERLKLNIIGELIQAGSNCDFEGCSPVILATSEAYIGIISELIDAGTHLTYQPEPRETALRRILIATAIQAFITYKDEKKRELERDVEKAIDNKTINHKNQQGDTVLIRAAKLDHFELIKRLLHSKAKYNLTNNENKDFYDYIKYKEIKDWVDEHYSMFAKAKQEKKQINEDARKFGI